MRSGADCRTGNDLDIGGSKITHSMIFTWNCQNEDEQKTVRQVLTRAGFSTRLLKRIRHHGNILLEGKPLRLIDRVKAGDTLIVLLPEPQDYEPIVADPDLDIIFQDDWYVVINKKPGQVVHPTTTHKVGTITDRLADTALHPILRLDRDTSGVILIARLSFAHYYTSSRKMRKLYLGIVHGRFEQPEGILTGAISRSQDSFMRRVISPRGKEATTIYKELAFSADEAYTLVQFELVTGRTHQIRLHCTWHGHPLLGDNMYGLRQLEGLSVGQDYVRPDLWTKVARLRSRQRLEADALIKRQALHAAYLEFQHVEARNTIKVEAKIAADILDLIETLKIQIEQPLKVIT